jgi:hypothetical protein
MIWLALSAALAEEPAPSSEPVETVWQAEPYWNKSVRFGGVLVNGGSSLQTIGGIEAGYRYRWPAPPNWTGRTRADVTGIYSLTSGSWGGGVAIGSFIGPDTKRVLYQVGPDLYFDGYGTPGSFDYYLPRSPGVRILNQALFKIVDYSGIVLAANPGWVLDPDRRNELVYPLHDLTLVAALQIRSDWAAFTVGWQRQYSGAGIIDGLILSGGI